MRTALTALALAGTLLARIAHGADAPAPTAPKATEISYYYDLFDNSLPRPITRATDPVLLVRRIARHPREAANVDTYDQVRLPSTWWTPRAGFQAVTPEQMRRGPGSGLGPAPGVWTVTKAKSQGVTTGFYIKDAKGDKFILKFDPPGESEMATGAEVVATYLFWAAGYNVPDNTIAFFRPESLEVGKDAMMTDARGRKTPMQKANILDLLERVAREPDGTYRAMASRLLSGKPLGPFEYRGRRKDDPDDLIPHELRRELRGLWTVAAWTHHADVRGPNSLDMWVTEHDRSFVRHHLIDFNGCLGSGSIAPKSYCTGSEYFVDYGVMTHSLVTLGLQPFRWESSVDPHLPCTGFIESATFDPEHWRPDYPNPAFDDRTERDIRWGARIVAGFDDSLIRAAVETGRFSDPTCVDYLTRVLIERRDKLVREWLPNTSGSRTAR
jgi:hypothetical protein